MKTPSEFRRIGCLLLLAFLPLLLAACAASESETLMRARSLEVSLIKNLPSGTMEWIHQQAQSLADGQTDENGVRQASGERIAGEDPEGKLSDALTFFATVEAVRKLETKGVRRDEEQKAIEAVKLKLAALRSKLDGDLQTNSEKEDSDPCSCPPYQPSLSDLQGALEKSPTWISVSAREPSDVGELRAMKQDLQYLHDTMSELTEMTSQRMETMMKRRSKFMSVLSSLTKKVSDTPSGLIQNLK